MYYQCRTSDHKGSGELMARWVSDPLYKSYKHNLIQAIKTNDKNLMANLELMPLHNIEAYASFISVANLEEEPIKNRLFYMMDLRGLVLEDLEIPDLDWAYTCFNYTMFKNVKFIGTHLQYSCFNNAQLMNVELEGVQASPICAINVDLSTISISSKKRTFLMQSLITSKDVSDLDKIKQYALNEKQSILTC